MEGIEEVKAVDKEGEEEEGEVNRTKRVSKDV